MKIAQRSFFAGGLLLGVSLLLAIGAHGQVSVLNNNKLRIGNGGENSINNSGNMQQPFYFNSIQNVWRKLTFSVYPLDNAYAIGGVKTNEWNINGTIVQNPTITNQVVDNSRFVVTSGSNGYGTIVSRGRININGSDLEIENTFTLPQNSAYIEVKVKVTNRSSATVENVRLWIGTRDDWVGNSDGPTKQRGNLENGEFARSSNTTIRSSAIKIFTADEGVLFYTNSPRANTIVNSCCSWQNVINANPQASTTEITNDGSYGFYVRLNDLAVGASDEFSWYYAAGELAQLNDIIGEVASVNGNIDNITSSGAQFGATSSAPATGYWIVVPKDSPAPTASQIKARANYGSVVLAAHGSGSMTANAEHNFAITGLAPATDYDFYFVTEDGTPQFSDIVNEEFATKALPVISAIADVSTCQDVAIPATTFSINDAETAATALTVAATSSNTDLIPNANISLSGTGSNRSFSVSPRAGQYGSSTISLTVTDGDGDTSTRTFVATVRQNTVAAPEVSAITQFEHEPAANLLSHVTGTNLSWFNSAIGGNAAAITPVQATSATGSFSHWVSQTIDGCQSPRAELVVTIEPTTVTGTTTIKKAFYAFSSIVYDELVVTGSDNIPGAVVYVSSGFENGDELFASSALPEGVTASFDPGIGRLAFNGTAASSDWQELLRNVRFRTVALSENPRTLSFTVGSSLETSRVFEYNTDSWISVTNLLIDEELPAASAIGKLVVSGADEDLSFSHSFVSGDGSTDNDLFLLDEDSLKTNQSFDFETKSSFVIRLRISDNFEASVEKSFTISLNNLNDNKPVIEAEQAFNIDENASQGTIVGTPAATDADGVTTYGDWTIVSGNTANIFGIDPHSGALSVIDPTHLDYESMHSVTLTLSVGDGVNTSEIQELTINVNNLNDTKPVIAEEQAFTIDENLNNDEVVGTVNATDADGETDYSQWTIVTQANGSPFAINEETGEITVANTAVLDFEKATSFVLEIQVGDGMNTSDVQRVTITLNNLNDTAPVIQAGQHFVLAENTSTGTAVGGPMVTDADGATTYTSWIILGGNPNNAFRIDPLTGVISINNSSALDFEKVDSYQILVSVSDGIHTAEQLISLSITNINDNDPTDLLLSGDRFNESVVAGTDVGTLSTIDMDKVDTHTYTLVPGQGDTDNAKFTIVGNTLTSSVQFNFDYQKSATIRVRTTDSGGRTFEKSFSFTIDADNGLDLSIPTAFTPDGDQVNDTWEIDRLLSYPNCVVKVYNSDGIEVFSNAGYTTRWDGTYRGKELAFGTYYYIIRLNGTSGKAHKGTVMIIK